MMKTFILFLIFESVPGTAAVHHIEFASRQSCEAAKVVLQAKAKTSIETTKPGADGAKPAVFKLIEATCLEK